MSPIDEHFDEVTGLLYLDGQLDAGRAGEVSAHMRACTACRALLHALETEGTWLHEALTAQDEAIPARVAEAPGRQTAHWGWLTAAALAIGGVYSLWSGIVEPWRAQAQEAGLTQGSVLTMLFFSGAFWKGWDTMQNLMELLAFGTLAAVVIWLLRRQWQRFSAIAFVMSILACALALPPMAAAAEVRRGAPAYTLPAGQEVKTDLIVYAARTRIDGDVDGDLIVWSQNVTINGHIKGDVLAWAQEIHVNGTVDGNVRILAQSSALSGSVGKNAMLLSSQVDLDEKAKVGGTMTLLAGASELDGSLGGDLLALSGMLEINGSLGNNANIRADQLTIGSNAQIKGHTKFQGRRQPDVSPEAKLGSPIETTIVKRGPDYTNPRFYWHQVLLWGASFIFGLAVLLVVPAFFADVVQASKRIGPAMGFGALFLFATPIAAIIACFTIVGLGLGIATILLYLIAQYASQVFVGSWLGEKMLGAGAGVGAGIGRLALGLGVLRVLRMLPYAGFLVTVAMLIWGLGALVLAFYKRAHAESPAAA
jgi:cytoskeletal protein CcmA (bactofilin family)